MEPTHKEGNILLILCLIIDLQLIMQGSLIFILRASSAIDYVLEVIANVSHHSPILLSYKFPNIRSKYIQKKPTYSSKINLSKLDKSSFKDALDKRIQLLNKNPISNQDIDTALEDLCHVIVESTEEVAPRENPKKETQAANYV